MEKYKSFLMEFNYPNINAFNDDQIPDIFAPENRYFLLTWFVKSLNSQLSIPSGCSESAQALIADYVYECGFCTTTQKLLFVTGNLNQQVEINIFDRIFDFLKSTISKENIEPSHSNNSIEDLESFLSTDMNLFPTLGPIKLRSHEQRLAKQQYYEKEIQRLQEIVGNHIDPVVEDESRNTHELEEIEINLNIDKFRKQAVKLQEITLLLNTAPNVDNVGKEIGFNLQFENELVRCHTVAGNVLQYKQSMDDIQHLDTKSSSTQEKIKNNEMNGIIEEQSKTSLEILKMIMMK